MPRQPLPLPRDLSTAFTSAEARAHGVSADRLRARDLHRPFRGVRVRHDVGRERPVTPLTPLAPVTTLTPLARDLAARAAILARIRAHDLVAPAHAFYIGTSALAVYGLPFIDPEAAAAGDLEVGVFAPRRALRRPGIHSVQITPGLAQVRVHDGHRVAAPASLWALLGRIHSVRQLVAIGDAMIRIPRNDRGRPEPARQLATVEQLQEAVGSGRRRGGPRLRAALPLLRTGSMSVLESDFRFDVMLSDLPEPALDVEMRDARGTLLGISDAVYSQFGVAIEVEGDHHRTSRTQWDRDIAKYAAYAAHGYEVVRLTARDIRGGRAVAIVRNVLLRRGWRPPV
ncbi:hypothetical protein ACQ143_14690 [Microbacterium sp. MC2]